MTGPAFTVIVAAYSTQHYVAAAIESVLGQTRSDWELIVVDDGSPDPLMSSVEPYLGDARVRLVRQENAGPGAARNHAARMSSGQYLSILDSDDLYLPRYLEEVGSVLDAQPDVGLIGVDAHVLLERTGRLRRRTYLQGARVNPPKKLDRSRQLEQLLHHSFIPSMATVRKRVFDDMGGYTTSPELPDDWDLFIRVAATRVRIELLRRPLAVYRMRDTSRSRVNGVEQRDRARELTALKALRELELSSSERRAAMFVVRDARRRIGLASARAALANGQFRDAQAHALAAFRQRPTLKGAALVGVLEVAPGTLRRVHAAKTSCRSRVTDVRKPQPMDTSLMAAGSNHLPVASSALPYPLLLHEGGSQQRLEGSPLGSERSDPTPRCGDVKP